MTETEANVEAMTATRAMRLTRRQSASEFIERGVWQAYQQLPGTNLKTTGGRETMMRMAGASREEDQRMLPGNGCVWKTADALFLLQQQRSAAAGAGVGTGQTPDGAGLGTGL